MSTAFLSSSAGGFYCKVVSVAQGIAGEPSLRDRDAEPLEKGYLKV
jgi:hypothetical protein